MSAYKANSNCLKISKFVFKITDALQISIDDSTLRRCCRGYIIFVEITYLNSYGTE